MPHCGIGLYESILRTNWFHECLDRLLLIGNRLGDYAERQAFHSCSCLLIFTCSPPDSIPAERLETERPCISRLRERIRLIPHGLREANCKSLIVITTLSHGTAFIAVPHVVAEVLAENASNPVAFNNTAVQYWPADTLPSAENGFWNLPEESPGEDGVADEHDEMRVQGSV